jgi:hypothetical protein
MRGDGTVLAVGVAALLAGAAAWRGRRGSAAVLGTFEHRGKSYRVHRQGNEFTVEIDAKMPWETQPLWQRFTSGECDDDGAISWWTGGNLPVEPVEALLRRKRGLVK